MESKLPIYIIAGIILLIILIIGNPFFILYEGEQAIITQFGKPVGGPILNAGLHLKLPFIQKVHYFQKRILEWDGYPTEIPTKDKKYIFVDTTARWRIKDPLKFYQRVVNERGAQKTLDDYIDALVRDEVTAHNLVEVVRSTNRIIDKLELEDTALEEGVKERIKFGRGKVRERVLSASSKELLQYGIEVIDVRIKRVNYIEEVRRKVYERMIAERRRAAEQYRSEGRGIRAEIEGKTEKELKQILSEAYKKAQKIKGEAEAKATKIYADAYNKDKEFYAFIKTLETYEETIDDDSVVVLTTESPYFRYLKDLSLLNKE